MSDFTLTRDNYYSLEANQHYMSNSQWNDWVGPRACEARAYAEYVTGDYKSGTRPPLVLGNWMHEMVLQSPGWEERAEQLSNMVLDGKAVMRLQSGKRKGEWNQTGELFQRMLERWHEETGLHGLLAGETEVVYTGLLGGIPWRCSVDSLTLDDEFSFFADLKTPRSLQQDWFETWGEPDLHGIRRRVRGPWYECWNYPKQCAFYRELIWLNEGFRPKPYLVAISKESPPVVRAYEWDDDVFDRRASFEMEKMKSLIPRVVGLKAGEIEPKRCDNCHFCRVTDSPDGEVVVDELSEVAL